MRDPGLRHEAWQEEARAWKCRRVARKCGSFCCSWMAGLGFMGDMDATSWPQYSGMDPRTCVVDRVFVGLLPAGLGFMGDMDAMSCPQYSGMDPRTCVCMHCKGLGYWLAVITNGADATVLPPFPASPVHSACHQKGMLLPCTSLRTPQPQIILGVHMRAERARLHERGHEREARAPVEAGVHHLLHLHLVGHAAGVGHAALAVARARKVPRAPRDQRHLGMQGKEFLGKSQA